MELSQPDGGFSPARILEVAGVDEERVELTRRAAPRHDLGRIGIPRRGGR